MIDSNVVVFWRLLCWTSKLVTPSKSCLVIFFHIIQQNRVYPNEGNSGLLLLSNPPRKHTFPCRYVACFPRTLIWHEQLLEVLAEGVRSARERSPKPRLFACLSPPFLSFDAWPCLALALVARPKQSFRWRTVEECVLRSETSGACHEFPWQSTILSPIPLIKIRSNH